MKGQDAFLVPRQAEVPVPVWTRRRLYDADHRQLASQGQHRGLRRVRVGTFRVVYEVLDEALIVLVVRVAHRRDAYRK